MSFLITFFQYLGFLAFLLLSFTSFGGSVRAGIILFLAALLILPQVRKYLEGTPLQSPVISGIIVLILFIYGAGLGGWASVEKEKEVAAATELAAQKSLENTQKEWADKFAKDPGPIIDMLSMLIKEKNYGRAQDIFLYLSKVDDPKITALRKKMDKAKEDSRQKEERERQRRLESDRKKALEAQSALPYVGIDENSSQGRSIAARAMMVCSESVKAKLHFPSSFDQAVFSTSSKLLQDGTVIVLMPFQAKNGFGNTIPQEARCLVKGDVAILVDVQNR